MSYITFCTQICHVTHFLILLFIEFYDNPSMFIDIGSFFYVRHNIF